MSDRCDPEVYKHGTGIMVIDGCMHRVEEWVQSVAKESCQKVDWHYMGGRAVVLFLGDKMKVLLAIEKLAPNLELTPVKESTHHCRCGGPKHDPCSILQMVG